MQLSKYIKRVSAVICLLIIAVWMLAPAVTAEGTASEPCPFTVNAKSALLMEAKTGTVLLSQNADEALPPASVTKIMTLLLVMEALDQGSVSLNDQVTVSAHAASMGGSQVFLEEGESLTLEEMLKCTIIASANDAALALAEHLCGTEEAFVARMNQRATELGMLNTTFENVTGLDDETVNHVTSARDIAIMSRALISHPLILQYSSIWQDTIRDGAFTLTNTNRLIRFYAGCNGLKTGSTEKALFCISATAERNGMTLIAVIMGAPTRDTRNAAAKQLFDYGFSNFALYEDTGGTCGTVPVKYGQMDAVTSHSEPFSVVLPKKEIGKLTRTVSMEALRTAPVALGEEVGVVTYTVDGRVVGTARIVTDADVERLSYFGIFARLLKIFCFGA